MLTSITVTDDNFSLATETFQNRYDNKRLILDAQNRETVTIWAAPTENTRELQKFVDTMDERTHSLLNMGQLKEYQDPFVV